MAEKKASKKNKIAKNKSSKKKFLKIKTDIRKEKKALFSRRELDLAKSQLIKMKNDILKMLEEKNKYDLIENEIGDQIDEATNTLEKEILFELSDNERQNLENIEAALRKIENSTYGICEHCGKPIEKKRLKAIPQSRYCVSCQLSDEKYR